MTAMAKRKIAETLVPISPPTCFSPELSSAAARDEGRARRHRRRQQQTTVEWPSEKKSPTPTGFFFSCISLRVTLSMAEMWSASTACRSPNP